MMCVCLACLRNRVGVVVYVIRGTCNFLAYVVRLIQDNGMAFSMLDATLRLGNPFKEHTLGSCYKPLTFVTFSSGVGSPGCPSMDRMLDFLCLVACLLQGFSNVHACVVPSGVAVPLFDAHPFTRALLTDASSSSRTWWPRNRSGQSVCFSCVRCSYGW